MLQGEPWDAGRQSVSTARPAIPTAGDPMLPVLDDPAPRPAGPRPELVAELLETVSRADDR
jgi:hypothetical protein